MPKIYLRVERSRKYFTKILGDGKEIEQITVGLGFRD